MTKTPAIDMPTRQLIGPSIRELTAGTARSMTATSQRMARGHPAVLHGEGRGHGWPLGPSLPRAIPLAPGGMLQADPAGRRGAAWRRDPFSLIDAVRQRKLPA